MEPKEDRSELFDELKGFSQRKLKKTETKVATPSGEHLVEKRGAKGVQVIKSDGIKGPGYVEDKKPDLAVGIIIPGLLIGSQDAAHDKKTLEDYEVTHILNVGYGIENAFEDEYNYKKIQILDVPETDIRKYFDECFEFIDEARHYGNCLVHCNAGVSRSSAICIAYLMKKEKMRFNEALAAVAEAKAFSRPSAHFMPQLKEFDDDMNGVNKKKEIDDPFTARKRAEIEAEKAALSGASGVKNRLKMFGAQLDERAKSASPLPLKINKNDKLLNDNNKRVSTPEPTSKSIEKKKNLFNDVQNDISAKESPKINKLKKFPFENSVPPSSKESSKQKIIKQKSKEAESIEDPDEEHLQKPSEILKYQRRQTTQLTDSKPELQKPEKRKARDVQSIFNQQKEEEKPQDKEPRKQPVITRKRTIELIKEIEKAQEQAQPKCPSPCRTATPPLPPAAPPVEAAPKPRAIKKYGAQTPPTPPPPPAPSTPSAQETKTTVQQTKNAQSNDTTESKVGTQKFKTTSQIKIEPKGKAETPKVEPPKSVPAKTETQKSKVETTKKVESKVETKAKAEPAKPKVEPAKSKVEPTKPKVEPLKIPKVGAPKTQIETPKPAEIKTPQPKAEQMNNRTIKLSKAVSPSITPPAQQISSAGPQLDAKRDSLTTTPPSNTPRGSREETPTKMVFGRVPPRKLSITGRTLSSAGNENDNSSLRLRSPSPANGSVSNSMPKRSPILPLKKQPTIQQVSSSSSSDEDESDDEEEVKKPETSSRQKPETQIQKPQIQKPQNQKPQNEKPQNNLTQKNNPIVNPQTKESSNLNDRSSHHGSNIPSKYQDKSKSGLNKSSTMEILKLIKTKSKGDLSWCNADGDDDHEDDEIDSLLLELEKEGIDNIDWDELGLDIKEIKGIVDDNKNASSTSSSESESESSSEDESDDEAVHMVINRQAPKQEESSEEESDEEEEEDEEEDEEEESDDE